MSYVRNYHLYLLDVFPSIPVMVTTQRPATAAEQLHWSTGEIRSLELLIYFMIKSFLAK